MKKNYNKPLLEVKEYDTSHRIAALNVSETDVQWTNPGTNTEGYKEFEW